MSRNFSESALRSLLASETAEAYIWLLTIRHSSLTEPIRLSSDNTQRILETPTDVVYGTVSRGHTFVYLPFDIAPPGDSEERPPSLTLRFDNIAREYTELIRSISTPALVTIELALSSSPDIVEVTFPDFELTSVSYDALTVDAHLSLDTLALEPFPAGRFDPTRFPGLFS